LRCTRSVIDGSTSRDAIPNRVSFQKDEPQALLALQRRRTRWLA
jgi:hypothetical protein